MPIIANDTCTDGMYHVFLFGYWAAKLWYFDGRKQEGETG